MHLLITFVDVVLALLSLATAKDTPISVKPKAESLNHLITPELITPACANLARLQAEAAFLQGKSANAMNHGSGEGAVLPKTSGTVIPSVDPMPKSNATDTIEHWYVRCSFPLVEEKALAVASEAISDWSNENDVPTFMHKWFDYNNARVSVCNWGGRNPCRRNDISEAWDAIDKECTTCDTRRFAAGLWYESDWLKGYFRVDCRSGIVCDVTGLNCVT